MKIGAAIALAVVLSSCDRQAPVFELLTVPDAGARDALIPDVGPPLPSPPDAGSEQRRADGLPCEADDQCTGGWCLRGPDFPGGYCTERCMSDRDCDRGACVDELGQRFCARWCFEGSLCLAGYECRSAPNGSLVCLPPAIVPGDGSDGAPCRSDGECRGARCFREPDWPDGYCTTPDCAGDESCHPGPNGASCAWLTVPAPNDYACLELCSASSDCRRGYWCAAIDLDSRACVPDNGVPPDLDPPDAYPFEMRCGATPIGAERFSITYDVPTNASSYMITPIARDGRHLHPLSIELPSGGRIDFDAENSFQTLTPIYRPWIAPTLIPTVSQLSHQLEAGRHTFTLESSSSDLCWQLISEENDGVELDLRIYFVGTGYNAAIAPMNGDIQEMLTRMGELFAQVGLTLSDVTFRDVSFEDAMRYSMVMELEHVGEIVALSEDAGSDLDSALVVNLFFVDTIGFGALGITSALPGPAALHRTQASGVISTGEFLGLVGPGTSGGLEDGNNFTALVAVHEIGHFLGLLHTSELGDEDRTFDPVLDTPECPIGTEIFECPDIGNVMFPFADPTNVMLTEGQGFTMKKNPLSKEPR